MDKGKVSSPPSPKVKASGGLPMNTSSPRARSTCGGQQALAASTSRWKCIAALGCPVVPEVKAIRQTSVAAVSTAVKPSGWAAMAASSEAPQAAPGPCVPGPWKCITRCSVVHSARARSSSSASRASHSAWEICALSTMVTSSRARSKGIVPTAMPPALNTARKQAASIGLLAPRSRTRLPVTRPKSCTSTRAMRSTCRCSSA